MKKHLNGWHDITNHYPCSSDSYLVYVDNGLTTPYIDIFRWDNVKLDWTIGPIPGVTHWKNLPRRPDA